MGKKLKFIYLILVVLIGVVCIFEIISLKNEIKEIRHIQENFENEILPNRLIYISKELSSLADKSQFQKLLSILYTDNIISYDDFLLSGGDVPKTDVWESSETGLYKKSKVKESFLLNKDKITIKMLCDYLDIELVKTCEEEKIELKPKTRGKNENN